MKNFQNNLLPKMIVKHNIWATHDRNNAPHNGEQLVISNTSFFKVRFYNLRRDAIFIDCDFDQCNFFNCTALNFYNNAFFDCVFENNSYMNIINNYFLCSYFTTKTNFHFSRTKILLNNFEHCSGHQIFYNECHMYDLAPEGAYIGYKKCYVHGKEKEGEKCIVKLFIPVEAKRTGTFQNYPSERKLRSNKAIVLDVLDFNKQPINEIGSGIWNYRKEVVNICEDNEEKSNADFSFFLYKKGETIYSNYFSSDKDEMCTYGIHHFLSFEEARDYDF